jgi:hypothetical protein
VYSTCLFCNNSLGSNDVVEPFPVGRRLAFDAAKGRLWVICRNCGRWNLSPLEERWEAIEECERLFRDTFVRVSTSNIGLARLSSGVELVRIGKPLRPEFAAWRYGKQFGSRRRRTYAVAGGGAAGAALALAAIGPAIGPALALGTISIVVVPGLTTTMAVLPMIGMLAAREYVVNERVVARLAKDRRTYTVRAKHLEAIELKVRGRETAHIAVPHDSGWVDFNDASAFHTMSVLLAGTNRFGADSGRVQDAVQRIEDAGDAAGFLSHAAAWNSLRGGRLISILNGYRGLGAMRLSPTERLALEMSLHEETERRALHGELKALEEAWKSAEEIAGICDEDLTPPKLYE